MLKNARFEVLKDELRKKSTSTGSGGSGYGYCVGGSLTLADLQVGSPSQLSTSCQSSGGTWDAFRL